MDEDEMEEMEGEGIRNEYTGYHIKQIRDC